jgi:hypothetical protein
MSISVTMMIFMNKKLYMKKMVSHLGLLHMHAIVMIKENGINPYGFYTPAPRRGRGVYCFMSVRPSFQDIFCRIFLSNCWWQKSDIWSQASYRYTILWEAFFDPSDSYFLFAEERGYHRWALAHSSSCYAYAYIWLFWLNFICLTNTS